MNTLALISAVVLGGGSAAGLIHILIYVIVICAIVGLLWFILQKLPLPDPIKYWANIIFWIICAIFLIYLLLGLIE